MYKLLQVVKNNFNTLLMKDTTLSTNNNFTGSKDIFSFLNHVVIEEINNTKSSDNIRCAKVLSKSASKLVSHNNKLVDFDGVTQTVTVGYNPSYEDLNFLYEVLEYTYVDEETRRRETTFCVIKYSLSGAEFNLYLPEETNDTSECTLNVHYMKLQGKRLKRNVKQKFLENISNVGYRQVLETRIAQLEMLRSQK